MIGCGSILGGCRHVRHRTAGIRGAVGRGGGRVAARGARAAARDAGHWLHEQRLSRAVGPSRCRVPRRPESNWLRRRPERRHRFPLGGRSIRSTADDCCRTGSSGGGRHCRGRGRTCGSSGCGSHAHDPYCIQHRWRSDQARHRAKSQPTSWQRDRRVPFCCGYRGKAAGASARSGSASACS